MKPLLKITILLLLSVCLTDVAMSQNLYTLPFTEKEIKLLETAKEAVLKYGPKYYKPTHKVKIESGKSQEEKTLGKSYYLITFIYDKGKELLERDYAAKVFIWADTGQVTSIRFGNNLGYDDLDKERVNRDPRYLMPYSQRKRHR